MTIAIARKLRALLNADPQFVPVLTRDGDYFISVMGRSDVARVSKTPISSSLSMLTPRQTAMPLAPRCGCSRTVAPTAKWPVGSSSMRSSLNCSAVRAMCWQTASRPLPEPGGAGSAVWSFPARRLRCGDQRAGSAAAYWQPAQTPPGACTSLGALRSPDIPSILGETGLRSAVNNGEERLLGSDDYQEQIAEAIYNGLRNLISCSIRCSRASRRGGADRQRRGAGRDVD